MTVKGRPERKDNLYNPRRGSGASYDCGFNECHDADTEYFVSVLEGLFHDLGGVSHHSVAEELWRIEGAIKSVKGER